MSTSPETVTFDNAPLVGALLARDLAAVRACLGQATLLLAASPLADDQALVRTGSTTAGRPLLWAFTDPEALAAWDRWPAQAAIELDAPALASLDEAAGAMIALNAAGPGAFLLEAGALLVQDTEEAVPEVAPGVSALALPDARIEVRRRAREADEAGRRAAGAGALDEACVQFEGAIAACGELGDLLHGAAATLELARCLARADSTETETALAAWERAAEVLARLGERDLAVTALLEAGEAAKQASLVAEAERLSVAALELSIGSELADRVVALWSGLE